MSEADSVYEEVRQAFIALDKARKTVARCRRPDSLENARESVLLAEKRYLLAAARRDALVAKLREGNQ